MTENKTPPKPGEVYEMKTVKQAAYATIVEPVGGQTATIGAKVICSKC
jgi:hypothetical protein